MPSLTEKDLEDLEKLSENPDNDALFYALYKLSLAEHICEWEDLRKRYPVGKYGVENCSTSDIERWDNLKDYNLPEIKKVKASDYLPNLSNNMVKQMMQRDFTF